MDRLDKTIADVSYVLDALRALRRIYQSGSCNDCGQVKTCVCRPDWGEQVRYNCPFYQEKEPSDAVPKPDGGTVADFVLYLNRELPKYVYNTMPTDELQEAIRRIAKKYIDEET